MEDQKNTTARAMPPLTSLIVAIVLLGISSFVAYSNYEKINESIPHMGIFVANVLLVLISLVAIVISLKKLLESK